MSGCSFQYNCKLYFDKLYQVEAFQSKISDLYVTHPILKRKIGRFKIIASDWKRSQFWRLGRWKDEFYLRKALFKDSNVPIDRSYNDRKSGEEYAQATDWEYDEDWC